MAAAGGSYLTTWEELYRESFYEGADLISRSTTSDRVRREDQKGGGEDPNIRRQICTGNG